MIILDFDDTLFDTAGFKQARQEALRGVGVDDATYTKTYMEARQTPDGDMVYSDERHAHMLSKAGFDKEVMLSALNTITRCIPEFLFSDVHESIAQLKAVGMQVMVVSVGDTQFNGLKVSMCGIDKMVDEVIITTKDKTEILAQYLDSPSPLVWFVNDKVDETMRVKNRWTHIRAVLKQSPTISATEYEHSGLPFFSTIKEISEYILKHTMI